MREEGGERGHDEESQLQNFVTEHVRRFQSIRSGGANVDGAAKNRHIGVPLRHYFFLLRAHIGDGHTGTAFYDGRADSLSHNGATMSVARP